MRAIGDQVKKQRSSSRNGGFSFSYLECTLGLRYLLKNELAVQLMANYLFVADVYGSEELGII